VCAEIEGAHTWDVKGRGHGSMVFTDMDKGWGNAKSCTSCGKCVQVCPTGALFEKNKPVAAKRKIFELSYRNEGEQMKKSFATVWLDGCSGCHMSFLDIDEKLLEVVQYFDIVYSPLVDIKDFPENVF